MIKLEKISKSFSTNPVLDELDLCIRDGEITALVGKNGAGKSTLIRIVTGLLKADSGHILMDANTSIGTLLGGDVNLYGNLTALENIFFFANLHNMSTAIIRSRIDELDAVLNFSDFLDKKAFLLSRGMRQKIAFAISIIHDPSVLLLDEPSTGLDIETANDVIEFIRFLKSQNKTILIATHNIFEIADLSDQLAFLIDGKIQVQVKTSLFFDNCKSEEKSSILVDMIREGKLK